MTNDSAMSAPDPYGPPDEAGHLVQGKWVILGVVGLSLAASMASWVYYARLQERPLALWGVRPAEMMLRAPMARAFRLVGADTAREPPAIDGRGREFTIAGQRYLAVAERDISQAKGFSHIRNSLIHDRSFVWDEEPCEISPQWAYVIQFVEGNEQAAVALAFNCPRTALTNNDRMVSIRPVAAEIEDFLHEQFPADGGAAQENP